MFKGEGPGVKGSHHSAPREPGWLQPCVCALRMQERPARHGVLDTLEFAFSVCLSVSLSVCILTGVSFGSCEGQTASGIFGYEGTFHLSFIGQSSCPGCF